MTKPKLISTINKPIGDNDLASNSCHFITNKNQSRRAFRCHFSCEYIGRYWRGTKCKLIWRFRISDSEALEGSSECQVEHEVGVIRSHRSRKTRVFWNKRDISATFSEKELDSAFSWMTRDGDVIQVSTVRTNGSQDREFDLSVNDMPFSTLPKFSSRDHHMSAPMEIDHAYERSCEEESCSSFVEDEEVPDDLGVRLSIAGFRQGPTTGVEVVDELRSDLYSSTFDILRQRITERIPGSEEMVSLAIINAFSDYHHNPDCSTESLSDCSGPVDPVQLEVDAMYNAYSWAHLGSGDEQEIKSFLQGQIESILAHVREEEITIDDATTVLVSVASCLGISVATTVLNDTVVIKDVVEDLSIEELVNFMSQYGEVEQAAIAEEGSFAICRFSCAHLPIQLVCKSAEQDGLCKLGPRARVVALYRYANEGGPANLILGHHDLFVLVSPPSPKSHSRHRMPPFDGSVTFVMDEGFPSVVTPDSSAALHSSGSCKWKYDDSTSPASSINADESIESRFDGLSIVH